MTSRWPSSVGSTSSTADGGKKIGITRVHLEEDAGKSLHEGFADSAETTAIDLNRSGVPLIEIVSEPDIASPAEAYEYLTRLKEIILYTGVSDCNMEEGSLRCDANISVRLRGQKQFGTKTEIKNVNSFRFIREALEYEIDRQIGVLESGGKITQETRLYNSTEGKTYGMRSKEQAHDYRYFPGAGPSATGGGQEVAGGNSRHSARTTRRPAHAHGLRIRHHRLRCAGADDHEVICRSVRSGG